MLRSREGTREAPKRPFEEDAMTPENKTSAIRDEPPICQVGFPVDNPQPLKTETNLQISDSTTYTPDYYQQTTVHSAFAAPPCRRSSKEKDELPAKTRRCSAVAPGAGEAPQWRRSRRRSKHVDELHTQPGVVPSIAHAGRGSLHVMAQGKRNNT